MSGPDTERAPSSATATLEQARSHARAQAGARSGTGPTLPASDATDLPTAVEPSLVLWDETVAVGGYTARRLPHDAVLRIEDLEGDACAQLLVYNAHNTSERLNVADTVKVQWQAYLGPGSLLLSDMGRSLMTVVEDTSGGHDCLCGASNRRGNEQRYGDGSASGPSPNARDLLALGGLKHGLARVDIGPNINLFRRVVVGADGALHLAAPPDPSPAGRAAHVHLRADLDVLVVVANTPHVLDDDPIYAGGTIRLTAWQGSPGAPNPQKSPDELTPERARAYLNTADHRRELEG